MEASPHIRTHEHKCRNLPLIEAFFTHDFPIDHRQYNHLQYGQSASGTVGHVVVRSSIDTRIQSVVGQVQQICSIIRAKPHHNQVRTAVHRVYPFWSAMIAATPTFARGREKEEAFWLGVHATWDTFHVEMVLTCCSDLQNSGV